MCVISLFMMTLLTCYTSKSTLLYVKLRQNMSGFIHVKRCKKKIVYIVAAFVSNNHVFIITYSILIHTICFIHTKIKNLIFWVEYKVTDIGRRIGTLMRNMLLLENPQFFPNDYEIMSKWPTSE